MLTKEMFKDEFDKVVKDKKEKKVTSDYAYEEYVSKVEPYLPLIGVWKQQKKMTKREIALLLGLTHRVANILFQFEELKPYFENNGMFLEGKLEKELLEAKDRNKDNHKFHETAFKVFHSTYGEKKRVDYNVPNNIKLEIVDGSKKKDE